MSALRRNRFCLALPRLIRIGLLPVARLPVALLLLSLLLLCLPPVLFAQAPEYRVRLFWRSAPDALEIAPPPAFTPRQAPRLKLADGREVWLRKPLRVAPGAGGLVLGKRFPARVPAFTAQGNLRLRVPGNPWGAFHGTLRFWAEEGQIEVEATLPREDYVKAVLAGEGGGIREPEALKALAIAIRSYAFTLADRHRKDGFHFCDTTHCQDLRLTPRNAAIEAAVDATADTLLWHRGAPVPAYHHADSGGHTESARALWGAAAPAWMEGRPDPHSVPPSPRPWSATLPKSSLAAALQAEGLSTGDLPPIRISSRTRSGRVARLLLGGREIPAADFRFAIGRQLGWQHLRSDLYTIHDRGTSLEFEGKGEGHGVGLSQRGAVAMARSGASYREILAFYFPGATVGVAASGVPWSVFQSNRLRFYFAEGARDAAFVSQAEAALRQVESISGLRLERDVSIRVYPTLDLYRNASGLSGDVAAGTRSREIHLQPLAQLRRQGDLNATLRHELAHALLLQQELRPLPEWLHEALARWMSGQPPLRGEAALACGPSPSFRNLELLMNRADGRRAVAVVAHRFLREALRQSGKDAVLGWARTGFPGDDDQTLTGLLRQACQQR